MSTERVQTRGPEHSSSNTAPPDARIIEITTWLGHFTRTLKTCRLYDARNPNTIKFREDLGTQMTALLEAHGAFRLEFAANQVSCDGHVVLSSRTREDNFAMPFYRDGLRTLTFNPDTEPRELDVILDLLLRVTSRASNGTEDLVTLLWDADMPHVDMTYVASETDADMGDEGDDLSLGLPQAQSGKLMPWPDTSGAATGDAPGNGTGTGGGASSAAAPGDTTGPHGRGSNAPEPETPELLKGTIKLRSDDWLAGEPAHELEERFAVIEAASTMAIERFMADMRRDRSLKLAPATLALVREVMRSDLLETDRADLVDLLVRVLHESIANASWADARDAVDCLTECTEGKWDAASLAETLARPDSLVMTSLVRYLDEHTVAEVNEFVGFARSLGPAAVEWLMGIVAISNHQRTRRTLVRALGELCEGNPERMAPWLTDERWDVVHNAVIIVAAAGGAPAGMFRPLLHHPEPRVRQEVVAALASTDMEAARPLLLEMIHDDEAQIRGAALHRLGSQRNEQASAALLAIVIDANFRKRPPEEVRSITTALGGCAGDEALPHLEDQLYAPKWFSTGAGPHCQAIARCLARIGTPAAIAVLEQGSRSRIAATRDACRLVLKGTGHV
jgi:hypothetical protein